MSRTAAKRREELQPPRPRTSAEWNDTAHGRVGDMHREIEQRLASDDQAMAVVALPSRAGDALAASLSRLAGWATLVAAIVLAARAIL